MIFEVFKATAPFIITLLILVVLVSWALFGRVPGKPETDCDCGGCAVLRKPIEGAHGVYDPRPVETLTDFADVQAKRRKAQQEFHDREIKEFRAELEAKLKKEWKV